MLVQACCFYNKAPTLFLLTMPDWDELVDGANAADLTTETYLKRQIQLTLSTSLSGPVVILSIDTADQALNEYLLTTGQYVYLEGQIHEI